MNKIIKTNELVICALFSALIVAGAFIKIPVPVVPFTLQFLFTNLAGLLLGRKLGTISVTTYIAIGLIGLPVFASGGGIGYILQPTFGYIVGFAIGSWIAGYITDKAKKHSYGLFLIAGFANLALVYFIGIVYYYFISNYYLNSPIGVLTLLFYGFVLAVPGDIALCLLSGLLAKRLYPAVKGVIYNDTRTKNESI